MLYSYMVGFKPLARFRDVFWDQTVVKVYHNVRFFKSVLQLGNIYIIYRLSAFNRQNSRLACRLSGYYSGGITRITSHAYPLPATHLPAVIRLSKPFFIIARYGISKRKSFLSKSLIAPTESSKCL